MSLFSTKLKVLVIHHDTILLDQIQQMCDRCDYLVTKCTSPFYALNLLAERSDYFDIMLIDVRMPSMDSYEFLTYVTLRHNIPVIVISSDFTYSSLMKSVIHGACDYWLQPLHEKQFKTMWQHVARKTLNENKVEHEVLGFSKVQSPKQPGVLGFLDAQSHKEDDVVGFRKREREDDKPPKETSAKKSRLSWTPQLHQQFVNAVNKLGLDVAKPRKILKIMDASGLTIAQVASHLQNYRDGLKRASCGTKSKRSPRIDTPTSETEQTNTMLQQDQTSQLNSTLQSDSNSETEHANSMLHHDQTSQVNSTLPSDSISETQQHSTDATGYQHSTDEAQQHSIHVGENQVCDIINKDFPDPSDWLLDYDELISLLA